LADHLDIRQFKRGSRVRILGIAENSLHGQSILVVEEQPDAGRALQVALQKAGARVLVVRDAKQALRSIEQQDFTAAVLDWRPNSSDQRTVARWFEEEGMSFLFCAAERPANATLARGAPILVRPARATDIVKELTLLIRTKAASTGA
jgi:DNA-binding response OmpR family regulator